MKVKFVPQNVEFEIKPGESVMHVAQDNGLYIKSVCRGVPSCAECRVRVIDGDHNVLPPGSEELSLIGTGHFIDRRRLSCQLKCFGDITVDLAEQVAKQNEPITGKRSKKANIKDDRIEDAHTRTASVDDEDESSETPVSEPMARGSAVGTTPLNQPAQKRREDRPQGGNDRPPRGGNEEGRRRDPRPPRGDKPQAGASQNAGGAGGNTNAPGGGAGAGGGGQKRKRRRGGRGGGGGGGGGGGPRPTAPGGNPPRNS